MTQEEFLAWQRSPATKPFLKYLGDVREELKEIWANGEEINAKEHATAMVFGDIVTLEWKSVAEFYGIEDKEEDDEDDDGIQE